MLHIRVELRQRQPATFFVYLRFHDVKRGKSASRLFQDLR